MVIPRHQEFGVSALRTEVRATSQRGSSLTLVNAAAVNPLASCEQTASPTYTGPVREIQSFLHALKSYPGRFARAPGVSFEEPHGGLVRAASTVSRRRV